jgi:hypothetical protein
LISANRIPFSSARRFCYGRNEIPQGVLKQSGTAVASIAPNETPVGRLKEAPLLPARGFFFLSCMLLRLVLCFCSLTLHQSKHSILAPAVPLGFFFALEDDFDPKRDTQLLRVLTIYHAQGL